MSAYEIPNLRFSAEAGDAVARRRFVKMKADGTAVQAGDGDAVLGVSSNETLRAGEVLEIYDGIVMVEAAGQIEAGDLVSSDAEGKAVKSGEGAVTAGYAVTTAGTAGELVSVKL